MLTPPSFGYHWGLLAWNQFVMTAAFCLKLTTADGGGVAFGQGRASTTRLTGYIYRIVIVVAGCAIASQGGAGVSACSRGVRMTP